MKCVLANSIILFERVKIKLGISVINSNFAVYNFNYKSEIILLITYNKISIIVQIHTK